MAIQIGGTTVINNSRALTNIQGGVITTIKSEGVAIGTGATTLNFTGSGDGYEYNPSTNTITVFGANAFAAAIVLGY